MTLSGRFITLEGGDGAGKSTQQGVVADWLRARGRRVLCTREPGGSPLAEAIRGLVLSDWPGGVPPKAELLLMFAARAAHWAQTIVPALEAGTDVVCDRFIDSSYAYQGARGLDAGDIDPLVDLVLGGRRPDLTLLLDLPPEIGLARAAGRGAADRFERADAERLAAIRQCFLARAEAEPSRILRIDARPEAAAVSEAVRACLEARWPSN